MSTNIEDFLYFGSFYLKLLVLWSIMLFTCYIRVVASTLMRRSCTVYMFQSIVFLAITSFFNLLELFIWKVLRTHWKIFLSLGTCNLLVWTKYSLKDLCLICISKKNGRNLQKTNNWNSCEFSLIRIRIQLVYFLPFEAQWTKELTLMTIVENQNFSELKWKSLKLNTLILPKYNKTQKFNNN